MTKENAVLSNATGEQIYDLSLIGLAWLRRNIPAEVARLGSSVIRVMCGAGALPESTRSKISTNARLISLAMNNMHQVPVSANRRPARRDLNRLIKSSDKYLIILVTDRQFMSRYIFDTRGYKLVITDAGIEYAMQKAPTYADHVSSEAFMVSWRRNAAQMRAMFGETAMGGNTHG